MANPASNPRLLNVGCGTVFDPRWDNIDLFPSAPGVRAHNILTGLPAPDDFLDGIYSSHVLEHLTPAQAEGLLREAYRALRPGGVLRIVVPDLEGIVRAYLHEVDQLRTRRGNPHRHRWMVVELIDQMTRTRSGGAYRELIRNLPDEEFPFAVARLGRSVVHAYRNQPAPPGQPDRRSYCGRLRASVKRWVNRRLGIDLDQARFRVSGEVHQWMYDSFSLAELLQACGFVDCTRQTAGQSAIPGWQGYALDLDPEGCVRKPDSLFMEARKPGA